MTPQSSRRPLETSLPAPRFAMLWASLVYAACTLSLAYPVLSGQFLVNARSDQYIAGYAFRDFAVQSLRAGQGIPHWNPFMFGGLPYVAAMHGDIFYPTQLLRLLLGTDTGMTWGFVVHLFLAGLFTYGFLRAWGLGFAAALVGGIAYQLSGPIASYASPGHDGKLFVSALLPLALWLVTRGVRDGRQWVWGAFALVVGLATLSPHPQLLQYFLLLAGAFALFIALGPDASGTPLDRRAATRRLALALAAVLVGLAIGAIQFAPLRAYVAWSPRAGGRDYAFATNFSFPLNEIVNLYLPQFTGILDRYWGENGIHFHSEYIGGPVLLLAAAGLWNARRRFRLFWLGTAVTALLWALGGNTPFFRVIYALVPGTRFFQAPSTIIYVFGFAVSILAALGTERVLLRLAQPKLAIWGAGAALAVALLATGGVVSAFAENQAHDAGVSLALRRGYESATAEQVGAQFAERATANAPAVLQGAWRSFLFLTATAALLLAHLRGTLAGRTTAALLALVVAADLWTVERLYWLFSPPARVLYATDPVLEYLKREREPGRVLVRGLTDQGMAHPDPYFGTDGEGRGTGLMVHGIRSVTGYHGNQLARYDALTELRTTQNAPTPMLPTFWSHENVRYLYTNTAIPDSAVRLLVGPVKNSAGSTVYLYRLPGENPYAWVATAATRASDSDALGAVLDVRFDPRRLAVLTDSAPATAPPATLPAPSSIAANTIAFGPGRASIVLAAPAEAGNTLLVSENFYPGWRATVDGRPSAVYRADYNLIGVPLAPGARRVELVFHDSAVDLGRTITLVAVLTALLALAAGAMSDRRRVA